MRIINEVKRPANWLTRWDERDIENERRAMVTHTVRDQVWIVTDNRTKTWRAPNNLERIAQSAHECHGIQYYRVHRTTKRQRRTWLWRGTHRNRATHGGRGGQQSARQRVSNFKGSTSAMNGHVFQCSRTG